MKRAILGLVALSAFMLPLVAESPAAPPIDKKAGYALLDAYASFFHDMAVSGSGGYAKVSPAFRKFLSDASQARQNKEIDQVFFTRYKRMLMVTELTMIPSEELVWDVIEQELARFVKDILGEQFNGPDLKTSKIGLLATALSEEILNLHLYLDDIEAKDRLRKSFEGKFMSPPPAKK